MLELDGRYWIRSILRAPPKAIRGQNIENFQARVEKRDLSEYEEIM